MRQVAAIVKRLDDFRAAGTEVVLLGVGTPEQAHAFRVLTGWKGALVTDPTRQAYAAAGLRRISLLGLLSPRLLRGALRARQEGFRQTKTAGDPWQLGGALVIAPGGRVLLSHRNQTPQDELPLDAALEALRARTA